MRRAANRDKGEGEIVGALRAVGATVVFLSMTDVPDLLVGFRNANYLLEVKNELGPRGGAGRDGQHLSDGQKTWHRDWHGQCRVVRSPLEALTAIGAIAP